MNGVFSIGEINPSPRSETKVSLDRDLVVQHCAMKVIFDEEVFYSTGSPLELNIDGIETSQQPDTQIWTEIEQKVNDLGYELLVEHSTDKTTGNTTYILKKGLHINSPDY